jgi:hypothetical protein
MQRLISAKAEVVANQARVTRDREDRAERQFNGEFQVPGAHLVPSWAAKIWDYNFVDKSASRPDASKLASNVSNTTLGHWICPCEEGRFASEEVAFSREEGWWIR